MDITIKRLSCYEVSCALDLYFEVVGKNKDNSLLKFLIEDDQTKIYGAYIANYIVGMFAITDNYINMFYVRKNYQNKKIGLMMMKELIKILYHLGYKEIDVDVYKEAYGFYEKLGYKKAFKYNFYHGRCSMIYNMEEKYEF